MNNKHKRPKKTVINTQMFSSSPTGVSPKEIAKDIGDQWEVWEKQFNEHTAAFNKEIKEWLQNPFQPSPKMPKFPKQPRVPSAVYWDPLNERKVLVNGQEYGDEDFVDGVLDLRFGFIPPKALKITTEEAGAEQIQTTTHEEYNKDYRGDSMASHMKNLEDANKDLQKENKVLKSILAGEKRVEEETSSPSWPIGFLVITAIVFTLLALFILVF